MIEVFRIESRPGWLLMQKSGSVESPSVSGDHPLVVLRHICDRYGQLLAEELETQVNNEALAGVIAELRTEQRAFVVVDANDVMFVSESSRAMFEEVNRNFEELETKKNDYCEQCSSAAGLIKKAKS